MKDDRLALFVLLGQTATKTVGEHPEIVASRSLLLSKAYDLAGVIPGAVNEATDASEGYRLFYVFENYLREMVVRVLSKDGTQPWWDKVPTNVQTEVAAIEETEESKRWMALGSRDKSALITYPQLLSVIDVNWKDYFEDLLRDKALIQEARHISHLRNTICHMSSVSEEEMHRIRQVMRDWFRIISP